MPGPENRFLQPATREAVQQVENNWSVLPRSWEPPRVRFDEFFNRFSHISSAVKFMRGYSGAASFDDYKALVEERKGVDSQALENVYHQCVESVADAEKKSQFISKQLRGNQILDTNGNPWDYSSLFSHALWIIDAHVDTVGGTGLANNAFEEFRYYMNTSMQ